MLRARLGRSSPQILAASLWTVACALLEEGTGCTWTVGVLRWGVPRRSTSKGHDLVSPHSRCFVSWMLLCTHGECPCLLLFAMLLCCLALPLYPRRTNGPGRRC